MALGTLYSAVEVHAIAAAFAEGVSAGDEQPGHIKFFVKLLPAVDTQHLTNLYATANSRTMELII